MLFWPNQRRSLFVKRIPFCAENRPDHAPRGEAVAAFTANGKLATRTFAGGAGMTICRAKSERVARDNTRWSPIR
jgi:hypothetical protein